MTATATRSDTITLSDVEAVLAQEGYEVFQHDDSLLTVRDTESGVTLQAVLEDNVLYLTVSCVTVASSAITLELTRKMLDAQNGISTSAFQLYDQGSGKVAITLNNFCKLQAMGEDDHDDILSCVEFLLADVIDARGLLGDLAG